MPSIVPSPRVRPSPFYLATLEEGVTSFTTYNHMLMPTGFGDPEAEYDRLINGVSMWDVAVERQVELRGPDAARLAQRLCARNLADMPTGMGWYVALCDHRGTLINDPILLKLADDRFWLSIADSDVLWWARAVAGEAGMDVAVFEPDVSPLAIQGPKSFDLVADLFGDWVREMKYFEVRPASLPHLGDDIPLMVARSGWSKQGGFELYLMDGTRGTDLWRAIREAGAPYGIGPGNPNQSERVESGLLSFGTDTDDRTNPFEVRMGRFVDLDCDYIGADALRRIKAEGPRRRQTGVFIDCEEPLTPLSRWGVISVWGEPIGSLTTNAWSPRLQRNIGIALVETATPKDAVVEIATEAGNFAGTLTKLPFI